MKNETNTQHTPAPWTFGPDPLGEIEGTFIMGDNGREFVAKIETISSDNGSGGTNEKLRNRSMQIESANAQLIARAPELLKENEQLKERLNSEKSNSIDWENDRHEQKHRADKLSECLVKTHDAINKAFDKEPELLKDLGIDDDLILLIESVITKKTLVG